jgi:hypothetical protein
MANDPVLIAYTVKDATPKRKARWTRVGVVFPHDRGAGLTLFINALPPKFDGRIVMVEPRPTTRTPLRPGRLRATGGRNLPLIRSQDLTLLFRQSSSSSSSSRAATPRKMEIRTMR